VNTSESEGFFPEREVLRARRTLAMPEHVDPSKSRTRQVGVWTVMMLAVFLPMAVNGIIFVGTLHFTPGGAEALRRTLLAGLYALAALSLLGVGIGMRRSLKGRNASQSV
jgi:hypothetical protein